MAKWLVDQVGLEIVDDMEKEVVDIDMAIGHQDETFFSLKSILGPKCYGPKGPPHSINQR